MNRVLIILGVVLFSNVSSGNDVYIYPSKVSIDLRCNLPEKTLFEIKNNHIASISHFYDASSEIYAIAESVDLNSDGICEVLLDFFEEEAKAVFILKDGTYHSSGVIPHGPLNWWYGEFINGYPRIFVSTNAGHKTNPIYAVDVYSFNGEKYMLEFDSEYSLGYFSDLGLKAYNNKNYKLAEKWYLNAYRMARESSFHHANNLALTYIK